MTTQGDGKFNYNNHPFHGVAGDTEFAFAHNGVLWNDKQLRKDKLIPDTHIETDSYAACQLIESQQKLDFDSIKYMAETVEGNFTFTVLDNRTSLYIIKGSNPMCIIHFPVLGLYVYASTESIMKKALKQVGLYRFASEKVETIDGDILCIDSSGNITRSSFEPAPIYTKHSRYLGYGGWYGYYDDYLNEYEEALLAYCNCYGVGSADVELLLEYGYTCDEIEEMLMDHSLLHQALNDIKDVYGDKMCERYCGVF
jgi:glutamine phosphoribosylpyrophosphate amidotransferase